MIVLAWISTWEVLVLLAVGLLLFGGRLPDVAKDAGRVFLRLKRSLEEIRRESGIDETLRDLERESREIGRATDSLKNLPAVGSLTADFEENSERGNTGGELVEKDDEPASADSPPPPEAD